MKYGNYLKEDNCKVIEFIGFILVCLSRENSNFFIIRIKVFLEIVIVRIKDKIVFVESFGLREVFKDLLYGGFWYFGFFLAFMSLSLCRFSVFCLVDVECEVFDYSGSRVKLVVLDFIYYTIYRENVIRI